MSRKLSIAEHKRRNTYRPHRHGARATSERAGSDEPPGLRVWAGEPGISLALRRKTLAGLGPIARVAVSTQLDHLVGWRSRQLVRLRRYGEAVERMERLKWACPRDEDAVIEAAARVDRLWLDVLSV